MTIHFSMERVQNNFGEKGFKVYLITDLFSLVFKKNALDTSDSDVQFERSESLLNRFTGFELRYKRNNDPNIFNQRHKPFTRVKRWGRTKPNLGLN